MRAGRALVLGALGAAAIGGWRVAGRYRRDQATARSRLAGVDRREVATPTGVVELAERGEGPPLLVSHGILHGCDGALLSVRDTAPDRRILAPSRFGYLGSTLPTGATPADQAAAFVAVLDDLDLASVDVLGISAGTVAAVALALEHPHRVDHLVVSSGSWPGSPTATAPPAWARAFYRDGAMWAMRAVGGPALGSLMGVPAGFPRDDQQRRRIDELVASIFPVGPRVPGAVHDAYVGNPAIAELPLEQLEVPTLVLHARDDPLASFAAAEEAAGRIPDATLVALDSGGHLGLGQDARVRAALDDFLG